MVTVSIILLKEKFNTLTKVNEYEKLVKHFLIHNTNFRYTTVMTVLENYHKMFKRVSFSEVMQWQLLPLLATDPITTSFFWSFPIL